MMAVRTQVYTREGRLREKLLTKAGRIRVPTEASRLVFGYADEIFGLGSSLVDAQMQSPQARQASAKDDPRSRHAAVFSTTRSPLDPQLDESDG